MLHWHWDQQIVSCSATIFMFSHQNETLMYDFCTFPLTRIRACSTLCFPLYYIFSSIHRLWSFTHVPAGGLVDTALSTDRSFVWSNCLHGSMTSEPICWRNWPYSGRLTVAERTCWFNPLAQTYTQQQWISRPLFTGIVRPEFCEYGPCTRMSIIKGRSPREHLEDKKLWAWPRKGLAFALA